MFFFGGSIYRVFLMTHANVEKPDQISAARLAQKMTKSICLQNFGWRKDRESPSRKVLLRSATDSRPGHPPAPVVRQPRLPHRAQPATPPPRRAYSPLAIVPPSLPRLIRSGSRCYAGAPRPVEAELMHPAVGRRPVEPAPRHAANKVRPGPPRTFWITRARALPCIPSRAV